MMRSFWKICITSLMLILCALVATPVSADDVSVLDEPQTALYQGQTSQVYEVTLNCPGTATLVSSYGARFDLYAKKKWGYGNCPSGSSIMYNYDKVAYGNSGSASMTLESGVWCLVVYGYSGSGSYSLRVTSSCVPTPPYPPTTSPTQGPCGVYRTDSQQGFLNQGQAVVYRYLIPTDGRSKIEWSLTSSGSCGGGNSPIIAASEPSIESACSGSSSFDLYVFKDCNPKISYCSTRYYSYGPNAHVAIAPPVSGSTYYVMAYARSGSGNYNLKMNSYKCSGGGGSGPIIAASIDGAPMTSPSADDTGSGSEVSAPTADFISSSGSE
jgi:hypothetical protein